MYLPNWLSMLRGSALNEGVSSCRSTVSSRSITSAREMRLIWGVSLLR